MKRDIVYQTILLVFIASVAFLIISATQANLAALGVDTDFNFLWKRAGFDIGQKLIPFDANSTIARAFIVALLNTLLLAFVSIICASFLGFVIGIARLSENWLVSCLATIYIEVFRNVPSLLQIFFWYFVVLRSLPRSRDSLELFGIFFLNNRGLFFPAPESNTDIIWIIGAVILGIVSAVLIRRWSIKRQHTVSKGIPVVSVGLLLILLFPLLAFILLGTALEIPHPGQFGYQGGFVLMPEFLSLVIGLSMYNATYIGEIVRSGFKSIAYGQTEAAVSLGLPRHLTLRLVLFPQALRAIIPPLTSVYLNLFKSTSLAAAIAYPEIVSVFVGTVNNLVGQPVIIMALTLVVYAFISICISIFLNWYNKRIALTVG